MARESPNSSSSGSGPSRWRALKIAALLGTAHERSQPLAHASPSTSWRITSSYDARSNSAIAST